MPGFRYGQKARAPRYPSDLSQEALATLRRLGRKGAKWQEMSAVMATYGVNPAPNETQLRNWCRKLGIPFTTSSKGTS